MAHQTGEKLRCADCGAELVFIKGCPCPAQDPKKHSDICCGKEMQKMGSATKSKEARQAPPA